MDDRAVTTIEGISEASDHPVQRAWVELQVPQSGYCQSGQIMQAGAMLLQTTDPSEDEIVAQMSGNICRCGTYPRILAAIRVAASSSREG